MADRIQVRFPRSKRSRIRKKWVKDERNYRWIPWDTVTIVNGIIAGHLETLERLKRQLRTALA
jgi:hypothetical protein